MTVSIRVCCPLVPLLVRSTAATAATDNTQPHRTLQQAQDIVSSLFDTPIDQWTMEQWLIVLILILVVSILCRCLCGRGGGCCCPRPYYGRRGSYYGSRPYYGGNGGCCSCSDIFWCLCCFEWCCRDCQDVDACCDAAAASGGGAVYQGGPMV